MKYYIVLISDRGHINIYAKDKNGLGTSSSFFKEAIPFKNIKEAEKQLKTLNELWRDRAQIVDKTDIQKLLIKEKFKALTT